MVLVHNVKNENFEILFFSGKIRTSLAYIFTMEKAVVKIIFGCKFLLAHLSRRLVGELIVYLWSGVRPSSIVGNFKHEYLCNQLAYHNEILAEASLGWGKGCIRFWARSD